MPGRGSVVFSHGQESGPWGAKITAMAEVARELGWHAESLDYRGIADPFERTRRLIESCAAFAPPLVLVGSSMGGHVAAASAAAVQPRALFLLAPAFYMPGLETHTPQDVACPSVIVHGWHDDIVPVDNSIRWARQHAATLHVFQSGHRLEDRIEEICALLRQLLTALRP